MLKEDPSKSKPKKMTESLLNGIMGLLVLFLLWQRLPGIINHFKVENQPAPLFEVPLINSQVFNLAESSRPMVIVFWATWCGPCSVELARINTMIAQGEIAAESVLAISSGEQKSVVENTLRQRGYQFRVGLDEQGTVASLYRVAGTPTVVFVNSQHQMDWITTGLSPLLGLRIKRFLQTP